jgi:cation diffusion facilitator CzcD-associated flavoprotein CzcO
VPAHRPPVRLHEQALFHTQVHAAALGRGRARWRIQTDRGDDFTADFIGLGTGPLHVPKLPGIPGIDSFRATPSTPAAGTMPTPAATRSGAPMDKLADKRVALIGTGATAVQCVPHLARACGSLHVFQRTPSSVDVRNNAPIDPDWFASIATPGWQQRWLENFTANQAGGNAARTWCRTAGPTWPAASAPR